MSEFKKDPLPFKQIAPEELRKIEWISNDSIVKSILSHEISSLFSYKLFLTLNGRRVSKDEYPSWGFQVINHLKMVFYRILMDFMIYGISIIGLVGSTVSTLSFKNLPLLAFSVKLKPNLSIETASTAQNQYQLEAYEGGAIDTTRLTVVEHPLYRPNIYAELQSPVFSLIQAFNTYKLLQKTEFSKKQLASSMHIVFERNQDASRQDHAAPAGSTDREIDWNKVLLARKHDVRLVSQPHDSIKGIIHHMAPMDTSFKQIAIPSLTESHKYKQAQDKSAEEFWTEKVQLVLENCLSPCTLQLLENLSLELLVPYKTQEDELWGVSFKVKNTSSEPVLKKRKRDY